MIYTFFHDIERNRTTFQYDIVEITHRESIAQLGLGAFPQLKNLELSNHVGSRLPWIDDISLDRFPDIAVWIGCVIREILNSFLTAPFFIMYSGINDQTTRAPKLHAEPAKVGIGIGIKAHVFTELFSI